MFKLQCCMSSALALILAAQSPSFAQTTQSTAASDDENADVIVVTGTTIRGVSPAGAPVLRFDREEILNSAAPSLSEFLRQVPQNTGGGGASEEGRQLGAYFGASAVSLRGFGPDRTLTLLNGARIAPSGDGVYVDIAFIPPEAIESVEILPIGASSIYGADAVGGVINFSLRDDYEGRSTRAMVGGTTQGGGFTYSLTHSDSIAWENGGLLAVLDYFDQDTILAGERDFTGGNASETSLTPEIERKSLYVSARHAFSGGRSVLMDAYYVDSENRRRSQFISVANSVGFALPLEENIETETYGATATLRQEIGETWLAQLIGSASFNDLEGFDVDTRTGQPTNIFGNIAFSRRNRTLVLEARADGSVMTLPAGDLKLSFGGQYRSERFDRDISESSPNSENTRDVTAAYGELFIPIVSGRNALPLIERLEVSLSGRYERFSDVEETLSNGENNVHGDDVDSFDPQFGVIYSPHNDVDLRATYGTSFTVAPLTTLRRNNRVFALQFLSLSAPNDGATNTLFLSGVDPDLGPEQSEYWSAGFDWRPSFADGLTLSATYYDIKLEDVLGSPTGSRDPANPLIADFVTLNPSEAQILEALSSFNLQTSDIVAFGSGAAAYRDRGFGSIGAIFNSSTTNLAEQLYRGFDARLQYDQDFDTGTLSLSGDIVVVTEYTEQSSSSQPTVDRLDTPFQPLDFKARLGASWNTSHWRLNSYLNYAGEYEDNRFDDVRSVDSFVTVDFNLAYAFGNNDGPLAGFEAALGVQNVFDQDPPEVNGQSADNDSFTDDLGYDFVNASARGRFVSLSLRKTW